MSDGWFTSEVGPTDSTVYRADGLAALWSDVVPKLGPYKP
jgi:hypothetical protein